MTKSVLETLLSKDEDDDRSDMESGAEPDEVEAAIELDSD